MVRITKLASEIPLDPRTLAAALRRNGIRIHRLTPRIRAVMDCDANRIRREGLLYRDETLKPLNSK